MNNAIRISQRILRAKLGSNQRNTIKLITSSITPFAAVDRTSNIYPGSMTNIVDFEILDRGIVGQRCRELLACQTLLRRKRRCGEPQEVPHQAEKRHLA